MQGKGLVKFLVVFLIVGALTWLALFNNIVDIPGASNIRTGIDIRGGVRATLSAPEGVEPTESQMNAARARIERRLDGRQILDRTVVVERAQGRIIVEIPWAPGETDFNPQRAIDELGRTALLTFQEVDDELRDENFVYLPTGKIVLEGEDVIRARPAPNHQSGGMLVELELSSEGGRKFEEATGRLIGQPIAIFLDDQLISAPIVQSKIAGNSAVITLGNDSTPEAARKLAADIEAGALPFRMIAKEVTSISPVLGENALSVSILAGIISLILVALYMIAYYRLPGVLASIALVGHLSAMLLFIALSGLTLTLPGIAGIILTIGMDVDANIIIFERIKEELKNGRTLRSAIDVGFRKAFSAIIDANVTTVIAGIILLIFGTGPIKSFAMTLILGVILTILNAVTASRIMLKSIASIKLLKHPWLYGGKKEVKHV